MADEKFKLRGGALVKVIGLCGKMGSGKDTAAEILAARYGYQRVAFADGVREEAAETFPHLKEEIWAKPTSKRIRILLQWWGTEYRRAQDELYWIKRLSRQMTFRGRYVVSDVRFKNEADAIKSAGGEVWLIHGRETGEVGVDGHLSERLLDIEPDRRLDNSKTIDDLGNRIHELVYPISVAV